MPGAADSPSPLPPSLAEVERIAALPDPALRNLQITQCYAELSQAFARRTGPRANWCTFATWASKQAGQSIRKEDLLRALQHLLRGTPDEAHTREDLAQEALLVGASRGREEIRASILESVDLHTAVDRTSQAVGRGNQKVFAEIGAVFARFIAEFLEDAQPDPAKLSAFLATLRPGDPPEGQRYLSQAFSRYYRSFFIEDDKTRAELVLCANLEIGLHEQTRLQPEIAEAMDAPALDAAQFTRLLLQASFPFSGWLPFSAWLIRRLLGRPSPFDQAAQAALEDLQRQVRQAITQVLMTLTLPPNLLLHLADDLTAFFPDVLLHLSDPDLCALLAQFDPAPDSTRGSGAQDWANFPDRLHFIIDLFRCYQESPDLFAPPFTPQQVSALQSGRLPPGPL